MTATLMLKDTRRIDHSILKQEVPIRLNVLCMQQTDHLLNPSAQLIIDF